MAPKKGKTKNKTKKEQDFVDKVQQIAKKEVSRNIEDKRVEYYNHAGLIILTSNGGMNSQTIPLSPYTSYLPILQGSGQGTRNGNQIKIKKAVIRGIIYPMVYDSSVNPQPLPSRVIFWLLYDKENDNVLPTVDSTFLQLGNTTQALQNSLSDCFSPVNTDRWRILKRYVYKLGAAENTGSGSVPSFQNFANNDFSYNIDFKIDYTKHLVKTVKFNDNTATPSTRGLFLVHTCVASNGSAYSSIQRACAMEYSMSLEYEDA